MSRTCLKRRILACTLQRSDRVDKSQVLPILASACIVHSRKAYACIGLPGALSKSDDAFGTISVASLTQTLNESHRFKSQTPTQRENAYFLESDVAEFALQQLCNLTLSIYPCCEYLSKQLTKSACANMHNCTHT